MRLIYRFSIIFLIVYATFFGGNVEADPLMKVVHQVGSALLLGLWLISLWKRGQGFPRTRLDGPLLVLGLAWLLSAAFSRNPRVSLEYLWPVLVHILLFYFFVDLMRSGHRQWVFEGLFLTAATVVLIGMLETITWYFGLLGTPGWPSIGGLSLPPTLHEVRLPFGHNNPAGGYAVLLIPLAWAWGNTMAQRDLRWALRALTFGLGGYVLLTQSRGAYLGLVALLGFTILIWLLRSDVRQRFPKWLQPVLHPRWLLLGAGLIGILAVIVLFQILIAPANPNPNDISRLDLWVSAIDMFRDHPLFGVGLRQYQGERLHYLNWDLSSGYLMLEHPHNLLFLLIAEGGVVVLTAVIAVTVRFARVGWHAWLSASTRQKRRLEGILVALLAFGVHNMVDAFMSTQLLMSVLIVAAYTVTVADPIPAPQAIHDRTRLNPRIILAGVTTILVVGQVAFLPVHRGALAHNRAISLIQEERYTEALEAIRSAEKADPWQPLYSLQATNVLGFLAFEDPETYLDQAIAAHEAVLARNSTWEVGWHNLASLYAQAGYYSDAVQAQRMALQAKPQSYGYQLKLGEYYELAGDHEAAEKWYVSALSNWPVLAASDFWDEPYPMRGTVRQQAVKEAATPSLQLELAVYSSDEQLLKDTIQSIDLSQSPELEPRWEVLWPETQPELCLYCFYVFRTSDLLHAELILYQTESLAQDLDRAESSARKALFMSEGANTWAWYTLARVAERQGAGAEVVKGYLAQATIIPSSFQSSYALIFGTRGRLEMVPQARVPLVPRFAYDPWLVLADYVAQEEGWAEVEQVYQDILRLDPYALQAKESLQRLASLENLPN